MVNFDSMLAPIKVHGLDNCSEKKVFSLISEEWSQKVISKFGVYDSSNTGQDIIKYIPFYFALRGGEGGVMERLYKVESLIILNFREDFDELLEDESFNSNYRDRVKRYTKYMQDIGVWNTILPEDEKIVFFLSESTIELKNKPKPQVNTSFSEYYKLSKLLNNCIV